MTEAESALLLSGGGGFRSVVARPRHLHEELPQLRDVIIKRRQVRDRLLLALLDEVPETHAVHEPDVALGAQLFARSLRFCSGPIGERVKIQTLPSERTRAATLIEVLTGLLTDARLEEFYEVVLVVLVLHPVHRGDDKLRDDSTLRTRLDDLVGEVPGAAPLSDAGQTEGVTAGRQDAEPAVGRVRLLDHQLHTDGAHLVLAQLGCKSLLHVSLKDQQTHLLMRSPLLGIVGVEHPQTAHLTQVAMEICTAVLIVTVSGGGVGTQLADIMVSPTHWGRSWFLR